MSYEGWKGHSEFSVSGRFLYIMMMYFDTFNMGWFLVYRVDIYMDSEGVPTCTYTCRLRFLYTFITKQYMSKIQELACVHTCVRSCVSEHDVFSSIW